MYIHIPGASEASSMSMAVTHIPALDVYTPRPQQLLWGHALFLSHGLAAEDPTCTRGADTETPLVPAAATTGWDIPPSLAPAAGSQSSCTYGSHQELAWSPCSTELEIGSEITQR